MNNLAIKREEARPDLMYGRVLTVEAGRCWIDTSFGPVPSERAVGCLIRPRAGDLVLASVNEEGASFVLSVLVRGDESDRSCDLVFDGKVNLHAEGGLAVTAGSDVSVAADGALDWTASNVSVQAEEIEARASRLAYSGGFVTCQVERIKVLAVKADQIFTQLTQRLGNALRYVSDHEEVQAGSSRLLVEDTYSVHSKNAVHVAEEIVKINAEQVHLG